MGWASGENQRARSALLRGNRCRLSGNIGSMDHVGKFNRQGRTSDTGRTFNPIFNRINRTKFNLPLPVDSTTVDRIDTMQADSNAEEVISVILGALSTDCMLNDPPSSFLQHEEGHSMA